ASVGSVLVERGIMAATAARRFLERAAGGEPRGNRLARRAQDLGELSVDLSGQRVGVYTASGICIAPWPICWADREKPWNCSPCPAVRQAARAQDRSVQLSARTLAEDLFHAEFEVLLYDLTSTYFECDPPASGE